MSEFPQIPRPTLFYDSPQYRGPRYNMEPPLPTPLVLHGEILVPYGLMQDRQPPDVEHLLQGYGMLPASAQDRRWQMAAERSGYVLTFTVMIAP